MRLKHRTFSCFANNHAVGQTNVTLRFFWVCNGEAGDDYNPLSFSADGGATWQEDLYTYEAVNSCQEAVIPLPAMYQNIPMFMFRSNWVTMTTITDRIYLSILMISACRRMNPRSGDWSYCSRTILSGPAG
ncbi:MAG: hypothetical protein R2850_09910 [Bacteroidia bacterium]